MTVFGPLDGVPLACTLSPTAGKAQVESWLAFDAQYALGSDRADTWLTVRYARTEDSSRRLRDLVADEAECCGFVSWDIEDGGNELRLIVAGSPEQVQALALTHIPEQA